VTQAFLLIFVKSGTLLSSTRNSQQSQLRVNQSPKVHRLILKTQASVEEHLGARFFFAKVDKFSNLNRGFAGFTNPEPKRLCVSNFSQQQLLSADI